MDKNKYELSFWMTSSLTETEVEPFFNEIIKKIEGQGGQIISSQLPQLKALGYKIKGETNAYFAFCQFESEKNQIEAIKKEIQGEPKILRFLLVALPEVKQEKPETKKSPSKKNEETQEKVVLSTSSSDDKEISLEELDQKLDEILKEN